MLFTQEAQKNDMFGVFARQINSFSGAAVRLTDTLSTAILTANAALADTGELFNSTAITTAGGHNNDPSTTSTVAGLVVVEILMRGRTGMRTAEDGDAGPAILNIQPKVLLTCSALRSTFFRLLGSEFDYVSGVAGGVPNPVRGIGEVVVNPYLDRTTTTAWYLMADPNDAGGVVVGFLQGEEIPTVRTQVNFRTGDLEVICEHKSTAKADGYRGMVRGHA